jgi:hypothetical protein
MNISLNDLRRQDGINGTSGYWRARAVMGSRALLIRIRAEHDANMRLPEGWRKPQRVAPPESPIIYPVIPKEDPYVPTTTPTVRSIQNVVASYYEVSRADLIGTGRTANLMRPRHVAVYLARELTGFSTNQIGRFFGGKDHTVVLNSEKRIKAVILKDEDIAFDIAILIERITGVQQ